MPRDRKRYRYIDVGLERGSWTLAMLEEDARKHHLSDQPGKLIALRLTEYYEWKKEQGMFPYRETHMPIAGNDHLSPPTSSETEGSNTHVQAPGDEVLEISHCTTENADEAAEYWASLEKV